MIAEMQRNVITNGTLWIARLLPVAVLFWSVSARAAIVDIVMTSGVAVRANLLHFDRQTLTVGAPCTGEERRTLYWTDLSGVVVVPAEDTACVASRQVRLPSLPPLCDDGLDSFVLHMRTSDVPLFVEDGSLDEGGNLHLDIFDPWDQAHGPLSGMRALQRAKVCRASIVAADAYPIGFCSEPRQIAVAFDYRTPLRNRILTNGFSFYVKYNGPVPADFDAKAFNTELRQGFQAGLSLWMIALQDHDVLLTPSVRTFVKGRTSTSSNGYTLFTPPQVVRLQCPHAATFVVELHFVESAIFPRFPQALARAQVEGRTIALNMALTPCYRSDYTVGGNKQPRFELPGRCLNLVPILAHELGHAFGLPHSDQAGMLSLMDSQFSRDALSPTDRDVIALVEQLDRSITGAAPGIFEMVGSAGVRPPADWFPEQKGD